MNNKFKGEKLYPGKKVLILGLGLNEGGVGSARFFAKAGAQVRVTDLKSERELEHSLKLLEEFSEIEYVLGEHRFSDIDWADIIIRNPALRPGNEYRRYAEKSGKRVELDMGILLDFVKPSQIIGVTGTKGKSTTSSLIYEVLKETESREALVSSQNDKQGGRVLFAGNIGKSVLDVVEYLTDESILVLEISSFQLEAFLEHKVSPHWAVITNITPDHLNYYSLLEEYVESKKIIAKFQTHDDFLFLKEGDLITTSKKFLSKLNGKVTLFTADDLPKDYKFELKGEHNKLNLAAALKVVETFGIDKTKALEVMAQFKGVPFRMELIYNNNGIKIYNDTAATTPVAAISALKTFNNCILICGGMNKGLTYQEFADAIDKHTKAVYFIAGDATEEIKHFIRHKNIFRSTYQDLEQLLKDIKIEAKPGDVILFSPGATSFNFWQNEFDRGRKFNAAVEKVFV